MTDTRSLVRKIRSQGKGVDSSSLVLYLAVPIIIYYYTSFTSQQSSYSTLLCTHQEPRYGP